MRVSLGLSLMLLTLPLAAQTAPQSAPAAKIHRVEKLGDHAYAIFGQGGNVGLIVTDKNAILIDDQFDKTFPGLLEAVRSVTPNPIRYLINTHHHPDHVGANALLAKQGAILVAHANVRRHLEQAKADPAALPEVTVGDEDTTKRARIDLHVDDAELHLVHFGPAHTDGDLAVGYPAERVLHLGDLFFHNLLPFVDVDAGGSFDGLLAEIDWFCTWVPEDVKIIPGHGAVCGKPDLIRYRDLLKAVQAHVKAHPAQSPKELATAFDVKAWADYKPLEGFVTWETLFAVASGKGSGRVMK